MAANAARSQHMLSARHTNQVCMHASAPRIHRAAVYVEKFEDYRILRNLSIAGCNFSPADI